MPVFLATLGTTMVVIGAVYTAVVPLQFGPVSAPGASLSYFDSLATGLITGLITGTIAALLVVLAYRPERPGNGGPSGLPPSSPPALAALGESAGFEAPASLGDADPDR
jgi:hypothetical protein